MNLVRYFRQVWPFDGGRTAVLDEYQRLKNMPLVMTDMALRAGLFSAQPHARDLYQAGWNEGRRAFALETFKIVDADAATLFGNVPKKPEGGQR